MAIKYTLVLRPRGPGPKDQQPIDSGDNGTQRQPKPTMRRRTQKSSPSDDEEQPIDSQHAYDLGPSSIANISQGS